LEKVILWSFLDEVWRFEFAVVPCFFAYLVFDFPIFYRRVTRRSYAPIYFAFLPYGYSDELFSRYFDDHDSWAVGGPLQESEVGNARIRILWISVLSLTLTMAVSPFLAALFSYYFLTIPQQTQFFYTLAIVKGAMLSWSLYDLRWQYRITDMIPSGYLAAIHIAYWIAILTFFDRGLQWIAEKDTLGGFSTMTNSLLDFFVYDIGVGILLAGVIGFLVPWRLTSGTAKPISDDPPTDE
jgi:hypothetical protein